MVCVVSRRIELLLCYLLRVPLYVHLSIGRKRRMCVRDRPWQGREDEEGRWGRRGFGSVSKGSGARGGSTTLQPSTSVQQTLLLSLLSTTAAAPIASVCVCVCWGWGEGCPSSHLAQSTVAIQVVIKDAGCARVRNDVGVALLKMVVREGPVIQG